MPLPTRATPPRVALAIALVSTIVMPAEAQRAPASDTLPLHPGQWGLETAFDNTTAGAGLLRMRSPRTALTLHAYGSAQDYDLGTNEWRMSTATAAIGVRRWVPARVEVGAFVGVGVLASYRNQESEHSAPSNAYTQRAREYGAGGFLQFGASYFATPRLAVSASSMFTATATRIRQRSVFAGPGGSQTESRGSGWQANLAPLAVGVALFL